MEQCNDQPLEVVEPLVRRASELLQSAPARRDYDQEPAPTTAVADDEILARLVEEGLPTDRAEAFTDALRQIRWLAGYYYSHVDWGVVREHETRTFLVIPLLRALGWAEQQMKIELPASGRKVDIALFPAPYRSCDDDAACVALIETKGFSQGLDYAPAQALAYAKHFPNCRLAFVTNGYCYKAYVCDDNGAFSLQPSSYVNLLRPASAYPLNPAAVDGCVETLIRLLPGSHGRHG